MNIFQEWAKKVYWFLPTKDEQVKYREEELQSIQREYMEVLSKLVAFGEEMGNAEDKLVATFSTEQHRMWLNLKVLAQKSQFQSTRKSHFDSRLKEIPQEIKEIIVKEGKLYSVSLKLTNI